jgi:hypothetical protein
MPRHLHAAKTLPGKRAGRCAFCAFVAQADVNDPALRTAMHLTLGVCAVRRHDPGRWPWTVSVYGDYRQSDRSRVTR